MKLVVFSGERKLGAGHCTTGSSAGLGQWFCSTGANGWTGAKMVNPLIYGIGSNPNSVTPDYIFTTTWQGIVGASRVQDVINFLKDTCGSYKGYTASGSGSPTNPSVTKLVMSNSTGPTIVTVTMSGTVPFSQGDTIWVANVTSSSPYNTIPAGVPIQTVVGSVFTYNVTCSAFCNNTQNPPLAGNFITPQSSWPIPTEAPYEVAWRAFVAAAIAHFGPTHSGTVVVPTQVAYLRAGYARGGESLPECQAQWPSDIDSTKAGWVNFYADTSAFLMGAAGSVAPVPWHMQTALNAAGPPGSPDNSYGTAEAQVSVQYTGGDGRVFGFGSQGLQSSAIGNCSGAGSDWCNQFNQFWLGGPSYQDTEFELQQIDCSDPSSPAQTALQCAENYNGTTGTSLTGDLRALLPCATANHMTILELYNEDALLAYDTSYCDVNGSSCRTSTLVGDVFPGTLTAAQQYTFYQAAGQTTCTTPLNASCGVVTPAGCYGALIDSTRGPH